MDLNEILAAFPVRLLGVRDSRLDGDSLNCPSCFSSLVATTEPEQRSAVDGMECTRHAMDAFRPVYLSQSRFDGVISLVS